MKKQSIAPEYLNEFYFTSEELEVINMDLQEVSMDYTIKNCQISISQKMYLLSIPLLPTIRKWSLIDYPKQNSSKREIYTDFFNMIDEIRIGKIENHSVRSYKVFYIDTKQKRRFCIYIGFYLNHTVSDYYEIRSGDMQKITSSIYTPVRTNDIIKLVPIDYTRVSYLHDNGVVYEDEKIAYEIQLWTLVAEKLISKNLIFPNETHLRNWCYEESKSTSPWRFYSHGSYIIKQIIKFTGGALKSWYGTKSHEIEFEAIFNFTTGELIIDKYKYGTYSR